MKVWLREAVETTCQLLIRAGVTEDAAAAAADVFSRAALHGAGHHDLSELPGRLKALETDVINPHPQITLLHASGAMEGYEGDRGLGEVHGMLIARRAVELAKVHGVGVCTIRNSNHLLACAPYAEWMAEQGMLGYLITRGGPSMGAPGRKEQVCGSAPQSFSVKLPGGDMLSFDACLAYTSFGELLQRSRKGCVIPPYWALDAQGNPTDNPDVVLNGGTRLPIGAHKGFGLAILGELLTGVLADGQIIDEEQPGTGRVGAPSHTAICLDVGALIGRERFAARADEMVLRMKRRAPGLTVPGERSSAYRKQALANGTVDVDDATFASINAYCRRWNLPCLSQSNA